MPCFVVSFASEATQGKDDRLHIEAIWTDRNNVEHREKITIRFVQPSISSDITGIKIILNQLWVAGTHYDNNIIVNPKQNPTDNM